MDIRVVVVARGIEHPWSIAFLPDNVMLVTQTHGGMRVIRNGVLDPTPVAGLPEVKPLRRSGLLDIALHPKFADNQLVYLHVPQAAGRRKRRARARARAYGTARHSSARRRVRHASPTPAASRASLFARDGTLYMTTPGGNEGKPQDPMSHAGKVLRLRDDGGVPADNPFVGKAGYRAEIYTLGHRGTIGLAVHPAHRRDLGERERAERRRRDQHPQARRQLRLARREPRPHVSGPLALAEVLSRKDSSIPIVYWTPAIAVSGLMFYTGERLPKWKGDVFVGSLRTGEIIGTGHIERILFNENMEELRRESLLTDWGHRCATSSKGPMG